MSTIFGTASVTNMLTILGIFQLLSFPGEITLVFTKREFSAIEIQDKSCKVVARDLFAMFSSRRCDQVPSSQ